MRLRLTDKLLPLPQLIKPRRMQPENYWTSFRGPNRDGRYDEMAVLPNGPWRMTPNLEAAIGVGTVLS